LMIQSLAALGAQFDCASTGEIDLVRTLAPDAQIIYANPCKSLAGIRHMKACNISWTTFDCVEELEKVHAIHPATEFVLRLKVDDPLARCPLGNKYGAKIEDIAEILSFAADRDMNIVGISFHVGSFALSAEIFAEGIKVAYEAFERMKGLGFSPYVLDIGGGFVGESFSNIAKSIGTALDFYFPADASGNGRLQIIAEPGRYFAESTFTFFTQVMGKRARSGRIDYWIHDGIYGNFNSLMYDHATVSCYPFLQDHEAEETRQLVPSTIFGPTCDGLDMVNQEQLLPELTVGDWLVFPRMGAYTLAAASSFNGFKPSEFAVIIKE